MKKLLAITVIFALVAGAAFAQVFGSAEVRWGIAGQAAGADDILTSGSIDNGAIGFQGANDDETYGGKFKFVIKGTTDNYKNAYKPGSGAAGAPLDPAEVTEGAPGYDLVVGSVTWDSAFAWWKPIEQVKFFLGKDGDGMFNTAGLSRWAHHKMDRGIAKEDWDAGDYLLGNWDKFGMALMLYPMDGLEINFALPIPGVEGYKVVTTSGSESNNKALKHGDWFKGIQAQVGYNLDGIGKFYLTYQGETASSKLGGAFGITYQSAEFIEGLAFEVGGNFQMYKSAVDTKDPIRLGVGVHYTGGDFGVKFRLFSQLNKSDSYTYLKADIMPWYSFGDIGTIFCNIRFVTANKDDIGWHINPYFQFNVGMGDFRIGAMFEDENGNKELSWKIPVSMLISF